MRVYTVLMAAFLGMGSMAVAQTDTLPKTGRKSCSCAFSSINQGGVMQGEAGAYFQFQTINGLRYKSWFAGLGVGLDLYPVNGLPVFLDLRKYILDRQYSPFVYADVGIHFADKNNEETMWQRIEYSNSLYYDVGVGVKIGFMKKAGLLLSGGYSFKKYERKESYRQLDCNFFPCNAGSQRYRYSLSRLSLKLGVQF